MCRCYNSSSKKSIDCYHNAILGSLEEGEKVSLVGFGTFSVKERSARVGVNPQTRAKINIPARKVPYFKAGKKLKDAVK